MATSREEPLVKRLADPSRPVFLLGDVPPGQGTPPGKCQEIANKFIERSRVLASDGFIVYDIQDEPGRSDQQRPFPFRLPMDSSTHGAILARSSGRECLVYKCITDGNFDGWIDDAIKMHGHHAINLVGRSSSEGAYEGPTMNEAMKKVAAHDDIDFGCVCIAERHTLEAAAARGKPYPTEHQNMVRKVNEGAKWFVSQAVYDPEPTIRLLRDYAALCKQTGVTPRKVLLTFTPVSRAKTMNFIKWLGVHVPPEAEEQILNAENPVDKSVEILCKMLRKILAECVGIGVPLGISCESVSIFKAEIDGVHELFRKLQEILFDSRGSPWKVQWVEVMPPPNHEGEGDVDETALIPTSPNAKTTHEFALVGAGLMGVVVGGFMVSLGVVLGRGRSN